MVCPDPTSNFSLKRERSLEREKQQKNKQEMYEYSINSIDMNLTFFVH